MSGYRGGFRGLFDLLAHPPPEATGVAGCRHVGKGRCLRCGAKKGPADGAGAAARPVLGTVGKYDLIREIGRGGMAHVYEAEDMELHRKVALKVLNGSIEGGPKDLRFRREAVIMAQLNHPNIVPIYDVGEAPGAAGAPVRFVAMELIRGETLADRMKGRNTPLPDLVRILNDVAAALGYAHSKAVVHRDVKPSNVLVDGRGHPFLTDFGLAHTKLFRSQLTRSRELIGTPQYMAPEQVEGKVREIDARTDVYAMGVILYQMLTGRLPFPATTPGRLFESILTEEPKWPKEAANRPLVAVGMKAMEKVRAKRYATAAEFSADLDRYLRGEPVTAKPPSTWERIKRGARRRKLALIVGFLAMAVPAAGGIDVWRWREEKKTREAEAEQKAARAKRSLEDSLAETFYNRGGTLLLSGDLDRAIADFDQAIAFKKDYSAAYCGRAIAKYQQGDLDGSIADCDRAIEFRSDYPEAYQNRGIARLAKGEWDSAIADFDRAIALKNDYSEAYNGRAAAKYKKRDWDGAIADCNRTIELRSDFPEAYQNRGIARLAKGEWDSAIADFDRAIALKNAYPEAYNSRAAAKYEKRDWDGAIADCDRAITLKSDYIDAYYNRGIVRTCKQDWDNAIADFNRSIELKPDFADAYYNRGVARHKKGGIQEAIADYLQAIRLKPDFGEAHGNLGFIWQAKGDHDKAIAEFNEAFKCDPQLASAHLGLGISKKSLGDFHGACEEFRAALNLAPAGSELADQAKRFLEETELREIKSGTIK